MEVARAPRRGRPGRRRAAPLPQPEAWTDARRVPSPRGNGPQTTTRRLKSSLSDGSGPNDLCAAPTDRAGSVTARMGTLYAIANQKGGVGKTTTAVNVAACIAEAGYPTIVVDVDPQANATVGPRVPEDHWCPACTTSSPAAPAPATRSSPTDIPNLRLLPAHPDLAAANMELPREPGSETRLRDALDPLRADAAFILLDCPPSLGPLTINALTAADRVIVPGPDRVLRARGPRRPARHARARPARAEPAARGRRASC